jgi:hypothetical protein
VAPYSVFQLSYGISNRGGTVAIASRNFQRLGSRPGADLVEQLTEQTERVNLIVMPAGRETQELGSQIGKPWCACSAAPASPKGRSKSPDHYAALQMPAFVPVADERNGSSHRTHAELEVLQSAARAPPTAQPLCQ